MTRRFGANRGKTQVYLNVYDLHESNEYLYPLGFGSFHSGVQVGGTEYTFGGGSGVFTHEAKAVPNAKFRESVFLGEYEGTSSEVSRAIDELRPAFPGSAYNILTKNCNHFSDALSLKLIGKPIPDYVNRLANIGGCFSCLLPPSLTSQAPVSDGPSGGAGTAFNGNGRRQVTASGVKPFAPSQGYKLGSGQSAGVSDSTSVSDPERVPLMEELDRRERMREAALRRLGGSEGGK